jgi:hypothetical protein
VESSVVKRKIPSPAKCRNIENSIWVVIRVSMLIIKRVPSHKRKIIRILIAGFSAIGLRRTLTFLACRSLDFVFLVLTFDTSG